MNSLSNGNRRITIYVDESQRLAIFSRIKNPHFDGDPEKTPMYLPVKVPIELNPPYTVKQVGDAIEESMVFFGAGDPYIGKSTIEEHYYQIKGFKSATLGKRMIDVGWNCLIGKFVRVNIATKRGKGYLCMEEKLLPDDATWDDFAKTVIEFATMDLTTTSTFRALKSYLNV